jgi:hypothetical protein
MAIKLPGIIKKYIDASNKHDGFTIENDKILSLAVQ